MQEDEAQHSAADLLVRGHDRTQPLKVGALVSSGQAESREQRIVPGDVGVREETSGAGQSRRETASDGNCVAVTPAVVVRSFDRVGEGVTVVEDLAQPDLADTTRAFTAMARVVISPSAAPPGSRSASGSVSSTTVRIVGSAMKPHLMTSAAPAARSARGSVASRSMSATTALAG